MTAGEEEKLRMVTEQIEIQTRQMDRVDERLAELVQNDEALSRMATIVGPACAASVGSLIGSPLDFASARALEKAMGLNLKERSSGNKEGRLSLTKRGPAQDAFSPGFCEGDAAAAHDAVVPSSPGPQRR
jgi:transposase